MNLTPDDLRIRQALEQIETPMYDIAGAVREQRARRSRRIPLRRPHRMLAALIAALLLTATAAAAVQLLARVVRTGRDRSNRTDHPGLPDPNRWQLYSHA